MNKFLVTEDNAGGLQLYVFDGSACVYAGYGFEQAGRLGELAGCIEALADGDDPTRWDGGEDNPRAAWNQVQHLLGEVDQPQVVVDHAAIYTERMGAAGQREFAGQIAAAEFTVEIADALRVIEAWDGASGIDLLNLVETYRGICISAGEDDGEIDGGLGAVFSGFKTPAWAPEWDQALACGMDGGVLIATTDGGLDVEHVDVEEMRHKYATAQIDKQMRAFARLWALEDVGVTDEDQLGLDDRRKFGMAEQAHSSALHAAFVRDAETDDDEELAA